MTSRFAVRPGHTDVDELASRADELCREARRLSRRGRAASAFADLSPFEVASAVAPAMGRAHARDPFAAARSLGIAVEVVPLATLQNPQRPGVTIDGRVLPGGKVIQVADTLTGRDLLCVVAHELAHAVLGQDASEHDCENFSRFFLGAELPESPREKWARWQNEAVDRVRRRNGAMAGRRQ